jgi:UDP-glucose 4-epimerase
MTRKPELVVVTGGAGFIGSHTVDRLVEDGYAVAVLDNFSTGKRTNLARWVDHPDVEIVACDVSHGIFAALAPVTARRGRVARIVHLAAQVSVVASVANPLADMQVNYGGTLHVLEYARAMGVDKVAFASSAAVYGDVETLPVSETAATRPLSPYGIDKLASEHALAYYQAVHNVPATALRFFNVYGPRQDPSSPYSGVISIFAERARAGSPLTIFGDGNQTRDFVYVADVVHALCAALDPRVRCDVANVGTGGEITINELAALVVELCAGAPSPRAIIHAAARSGEIARSRADVTRLRALGVPAPSGLRDGLRATLA